MPTKEELERQVADLQEKLYEAGVEERPTIMKTIKDEEDSTLQSINWNIAECVKKTGRDFPQIILMNNKVRFADVLAKCTWDAATFASKSFFTCQLEE